MDVTNSRRNARPANSLSRQLARAGVSVALVAAMTVGSLPAYADADAKPAPSEMIADVAIARPFGAVMTVLGTAAFVVSLPFSALGGNIDEAADQLVIGPAKSTFVRCLGCRNLNNRNEEE